MIILNIASAFFKEHIRRKKFFLYILFVLVVFYMFSEPYRQLYKFNILRFFPLTSGLIGEYYSTILEYMFYFISFFLFKGALEDDSKAGITEILASSGLGKFRYFLGKICGIFFYQGVLIAGGILSGFIIQTIYKNSMIQPFQLIYPVLLKTIPAVFFGAGLAALIYLIPFLRNKLGDLLFLYIFLKYFWNLREVLKIYNPIEFYSNYLEELGQAATQKTMYGEVVVFPGLPLKPEIYIPYILLFLIGISLLFFSSFFFKYYSKPFSILSIFKFRSKEKNKEKRKVSNFYSTAVMTGQGLKTKSGFGLLLNQVKAEMFYIFRLKYWLFGMPFLFMMFSHESSDNFESIPTAYFLIIFSISGFFSRDFKARTNEITGYINNYVNWMPVWKFVSAYFVSLYILLIPFSIKLSKGEISTIILSLIGVGFLISVVQFFEILLRKKRFSTVVSIIFIIFMALIAELNNTNDIPDFLLGNIKWFDYHGAIYNGKYLYIPLFYICITVFTLFLTRFILKRRKMY